MKTSVVYIKCDKCEHVQEYHGQYRCDACKQRLSNWSIANQLQSSRDKEFLEQFKGNR